MSKHKKQKNKNVMVSLMLKKISSTCITGYLLIIILFPYLAGEQLYIKESKGNIKMPVAQSGTVEMCVGNMIDQHFTVSIQRLEKVSVQWGTYYRPNTGTVVAELYNMETEQLLLSASYDASSITEGGVTILQAEQPIENIDGAPLILRLYSPDSQSGSSVSPLMYTESTLANTLMFFNGIPEPVTGTLCFSVEGTDYTWIGFHYWELISIGFVLLLISLYITWKKQKEGRVSYILSTMEAVQNYRFLIRQLVSRDFKTKYKRSILGMFWSFLNPLLMMCVQYFIFSTLFKSDIPNYAAYLLIGIVCFNFFSEVCNMSLFSILGNANLITKVYIPKYIYALTRVLSSVVNLGISLIPMITVCVVTGVQFEKSAVLSLFFLLCLIVFSLGMALILSSAMVFFRDTQFLWNVFSTIWMYATAIFYPESILPQEFRFVLDINPLYHYIKNIRICILDGISPEPLVYGICFLMSAVTLLLGALIFKKSQDKFVLYL